MMHLVMRMHNFSFWSQL